MVEISQIEYSFSPNDNYISQLCNLPQNEQERVIDAMLTERIVSRVTFDFLNSQTIGFAGKMYDRYGQLIIDSRFVLNGYHQFSPRQIIIGNGLPQIQSFQLYQKNN